MSSTPQSADRPAPTKADPRALALLSQAVHAGNSVDAATGALRTPITMANSYELSEDPSSISWSTTEAGLYTRNGGVNQAGLQTKLAVLEHGEEAVALASGVAALHAVFFTFLDSGDHAVVSDTCYEATYKLFTEFLPRKYGITATFVDSTDPEAVRAAMTPNTRLVHVETPANPTTAVTDIDAVAAVTHEGGALLSVDSTFASPILLRPLEHGADLVVHSLTKYINGHGDAMGGAVIGSSELIAKVKAEAMIDVGGVISPFNAWLIMRGSVTLPLRMRQHCESALRLARFLEGRPEVAHIAYPGLESHPQHDVALRQMPDGFGGVMSFALHGGAQAHNAFVANLAVVTSAVSLGHDESLIVHVGTEGPRVASYPEPFRVLGHLRFSVGLEDADDLERDLGAALDALSHS